MRDVLAYVAGPYRAPTIRQVVENIRRAEAVALALWRADVPAICPHLNTACFDGAAPDAVWLAGDLVMLRRCDVVVLVDGWQASSGTRAEVEAASLAGIPAFESVDEAVAWVRARASDARDARDTGEEAA